MEIVFGVTKRSILGCLLFNIFLCDLLFILNSMDIANYVDEKTADATVNDIHRLIASR